MSVGHRPMVASPAAGLFERPSTEGYRACLTVLSRPRISRDATGLPPRSLWWHGSRRRGSPPKVGSVSLSLPGGPAAFATPGVARSMSRPRTASDRLPSFRAFDGVGFPCPCRASPPGDDGRGRVCALLFYTPAAGRGAARGPPQSALASADAATWLILPVVICLSQRLSHACPSTSLRTKRNCEWLIKSVMVPLIVTPYSDNCGNSRANTCE